MGKASFLLSFPSFFPCSSSLLPAPSCSYPQLRSSADKIRARKRRNQREEGGESQEAGARERKHFLPSSLALPKKGGGKRSLRFSFFCSFPCSASQREGKRSRQQRKGEAFPCS
uniref:hypothetical protein 17 n=1 Tax=Moniliophthora perniciosa TaxID=153609 RepID=UPI000024234F|nr:hypothetical protein 17 [Moniliophthora perniciosa]AAQ74307.1 hypothetical protein 17 [Moniliophthora perniciosa]